MIKFSAVTKQFGADFSGLFDVNFSIEPGEMLFITGPSGSGKTTLMRLLTKEYVPSSGEIEFEGVPLSAIKERDLHHHRRKIGVVFQDYRLLPELNVWENIALPLSIIGKPQHEIEERVTDLLKLVQLTSKAALFPRQLSGGEAQRISIARALAIAPSVICADEPTGNLDRDTATSIAHLLHTINKLGTTVLFATHDPHIISLFADLRRIHLDEGKVVNDTHADQPSKKQSTEPSEKKPDTRETKAKSSENKKHENENTSEDVTEQSESKKEAASSNKKPGFFDRWFGKSNKPDTTSDTKPKTKTDNEPDTETKPQKKGTEETKKNGKKSVTVKVESLDDA